MRKKHEEEHENHERWLVSYADFITLLFAFFTVLYATSQRNEQKAKEFEQSIKTSMMPFADINWFLQLKGTPDDGAALKKKAMVRGTGMQKVDVEQMITDRFPAEEAKRLGLRTTQTEFGVAISLATSALFSSGSSKLQPEAFDALAYVGAVLSELPNRLIIEGHTDNLPISTEAFPTNWELSSARAVTVVRFLTEFAKIKPERLVVVGYADQRPLVTNDTEERRSLNRRMTIVVVKEEVSKNFTP